MTTTVLGSTDVTQAETHSEIPLLSICVPTYNRAEKLKSLLRSLAPQSANLNGLVEIVVSDNCSSDNTTEAVDWARQFGPIRYHRNEQNIGGARNFVQLAQVLARGEYCWLLGDDDIIRPDCLQEIVRVLHGNRGIDCVFMNSTLWLSSRDGSLVEADVHPSLSPSICGDYETRIVDRWEDIEQFANGGHLFTYIGSDILRTSLWKDQEILVEDDRTHPSMKTTFAHVYVTAIHMVGKPAAYIGYPYILVNCETAAKNSSENDYGPLIELVRMMEVSDLLASQGATPSMVRRYRNLQMGGSSASYWRLVFDKRLPRREEFHPQSLLLRYWSYSGYWRMLFGKPLSWLRERLSPVKSAARRIVRRQT